MARPRPRRRADRDSRAARSRARSARAGALACARTPRSTRPGATFVTLTAGRRAARLHRQPRGAPAARDRRARERARRRLPRPALPAARARGEFDAIDGRGVAAVRRRRASRSPTRTTCSRSCGPASTASCSSCGRRRATFLPQVWEPLPDPREFLARAQAQGGPAGGLLERRACASARYTRDQVAARPNSPSSRQTRRSDEHDATIPAAGGTASTTAASSATCARATAGCTRASAARASCASARATRWC